MKKEIHRIEKRVFFEGLWILSEEVFCKKPETFEDGEKEILYEDEKEKESIFFETFFMHIQVDSIKQINDFSLFSFTKNLFSYNQPHIM